MHWHSVAEFISMGGYAFYVWSAYGLFMGLVAINVLPPLLRRRVLLRRLAKQVQK